jgi:hypothetical protein
LDYFKDKLYHALNVPKSRFVQDSGFSIGRSDTVSRDEVKFAKFITKQRSKFSSIFLELLKIQLICKGIFSAKDWDSLKEKLVIRYAKDNYFAELKENEILNTRLQTVAQLDPFVGKYVSKAYIQQNVLRLTEEEIADIDKQMEEERAEDIKNGLIPDPAQMQDQFNQQQAEGQ